MEFLIDFGKTKEGKIIVFDVFTFDSLFTILLNKNFSYKDALNFILAECELNAYVFQECIHNNAYLNIIPRKIDIKEAGRRSTLNEVALSFF